MGNGVAPRNNQQRKRRKPKRSAPSTQSSANGTLGTGQSRDFQFAEYQLVHASFFDHTLVFTPNALTKFAKIQDKYIYAFELGPRDSDQNPLLVKEYHADKDGALSFVDGAKRRLVEFKAATNWVSIKAVSLPLIKNGKPVRYAFVVTRGRVSKSTIQDMENGLHHVYHPMYLGDDMYFGKGDDGTSFVSVIDPLTLAYKLNDAYQAALNDFTNYTVPNEKAADELTAAEKAQNAKVEARNARFQLARMIKDTLLAPDGHVTDPLNLCKYLDGNGNPLLQEISEHESKLRKLSWKRRNAAQELVTFFRSSLWSDAHRWYLGTPSDANEIGHFWLGSWGQNLDRLNETPEGRQFEAQLLNLEKGTDPSKNWVKYLFHPEEASEPHAKELYHKIFPIARKAATGVVIGIAEMAPALIVHGEVKAANRRILLTLKAFLEHTEMTVDVVAVGPGGIVMGAMKFQTPTVRFEITLETAKPDVEEWLHHGKGVWPDETRFAKPAEILTRIFMLVEAVNFFNKLAEMVDVFNKQPAADHVRKDCFAAECVAAALDLVVACEEPILAFAHQFARKAGHGASHGAHAAGAAAHAGEAEEAAAFAAGKRTAKSLFGKITGPVVFKGLGAASAAIDAVVYYIEAREAAAKGDTGVSVGNYLISGGSAIMAVASVANAAGYIVTASAVATDGALAAGTFLTAAAATALVVGVVIVAAGFLIVTLFTTTAWQKFIRHTPWGDSPAEPGWDTWSGGNFSEWTPTKRGYERQIQVLTAMLCAYHVHGDGYEGHAVTISFGSVPPNALLEIDFWFAYADGEQKTVGYTIELENRNVKQVRGDAAHFGKTPIYPNLLPYWIRDRLTGLRIFAPKLVNDRLRLTDSICSVLLRYGHGSAKAPVLTGTIPIKDKCVYKIVERSGSVHFDELHSLDVGKEEEEEKGEKGEKGEEHKHGEGNEPSGAESGHAE